MNSTSPAAGVLRPYEPTYDPLVARTPGHGNGYAPSYWVASAGAPPEDDGPITADAHADVVIIGAGSTGISTAMYLAQEHGIKAIVLEANQSAWGCSSRSGGQGQNASGRLTRSQWIERWGMDVAKKLDTEIRTGFENFRSLVSEIDCEAYDGGHLYLAHRPEKVDVFAEHDEGSQRGVWLQVADYLVPKRSAAITVTNASNVAPCWKRKALACTHSNSPLD